MRIMTAWDWKEHIEVPGNNRCYFLFQSARDVIWLLFVNTAAVNHRQKKMGYNAAQELYRRVQANMTKSNDDIV